MMQCSLLSLGCVFGFASATEQTTLTALKALKIAQRRLRPEVRAKLLSVSSARVTGNLVPDAWRFVFLDLATSGHCRVVTVAAKTSSEHPDTVEAFSSTKLENIDELHPIPQNKLFVDSEKVLALARKQTSMKGVTGAQYKLLQPNHSKEPVWTVEFYGEGAEPLSEVEVGARSAEMVTERMAA